MTNQTFTRLRSNFAAEKPEAKELDPAKHEVIEYILPDLPENSPYVLNCRKRGIIPKPRVARRVVPKPTTASSSHSGLPANATRTIPCKTPPKKIKPVPPTLTRSKVPITIRLQFAPGNAKTKDKRTPHPIQTSIAKSLARSVGESEFLQIRIRVDGKRDSGFNLRMSAPMVNSKTGETYYVSSQQNNYGEFVTVDPRLWDVKRQCIIGRSKEVMDFNQEIIRVKDRIKSVFYEQRERFSRNLSPEPTFETVKFEYITGQKILTQQGKMVVEQRSIVGGFDAYYQHLLSQQDTELALSEASLYKRKHTRANLVNFLAYEETPDLEAKQINQGWAKRFYNWLMQDGRMLPCSARMEVGVIRMALAYLVELDQLPVNPLLGLKLPKGKKKPVVWLSPDQVEALWHINACKAKRGNEVSLEAIESALFWLKVIVLTGMDYLDAVCYVDNRSAYDCIGIGGRKIVINRGKNGSECHIPVTDKLEELLAGPIPRVYSIDHMNNALTPIGKLIGFTHSLTTKVGRKTAGAMWMLEGYTIHEISRFLGHSSIAMTESHYVKTSGITADRGMLRMQEQHQGSQQRQQSNRNPFPYTYKAS